MARQMVGRFGMSEAIGPIRLMGRDLDVYLEGGAVAPEGVSPQTLREFDDAVRDTVKGAQKRAIEVLTRCAATLDALTDTLLESETLEGAELLAVLAPVLPGSGASSNGSAPKQAATPAP
jgi:cell division protease FtsH